MDLLALGGVLAVTIILLVADNRSDVLGLALIALGLISALAAVSRRRYVRETQIGFDIVATRGGRFVLGSALVFLITAALVTLLILFR